MTTMIAITIDASRYSDHDDCLTAAAEDYARRHDLVGWDLSPRWVDERNREEIELTVPASVTVATITDSQIRALREEAHAASNYHQATLCSVALAPREFHDEQTAEPHHDEAGTPISRTEARQACAEAIAWAQAQS